MRLKPLEVIADSLALFARNAVPLYLDFLAAGVAATTLFFLLMPGQAVLMFSDTPGENTALHFFNGYSVISSAIFGVVSAGAFLRLWRATGGGPVAGPRGSDWIAIIAVSLVIDHLMIVAISLLVLPAMILAAATSVVTPALVLERRGLGAIQRSLQMTAGNVWPLTAVWAALLLPWIALLIVSGRGGPATGEQDLTTLWWGAIVSDLAAPVFVGLGLCMTLTIYRHLSAGEGGGRNIDEIFR